MQLQLHPKHTHHPIQNLSAGPWTRGDDGSGMRQQEIVRQAWVSSNQNRVCCVRRVFLVHSGLAQRRRHVGTCPLLRELRRGHEPRHVDVHMWERAEVDSGRKGRGWRDGCGVSRWWTKGVLDMDGLCAAQGMFDQVGWLVGWLVG